MSNDSIIANLEDQMAGAVFQQLVAQHLDSIELTVLLTARLGEVYNDVLVVVLAAIIGRLLINECPDHARQYYADLAKRMIDAAIQYSNKE